MLLNGACQNSPWNKLLPHSADLGSNRGFQFVRIITHLHSPLSYDACDANNTHCLQDLRSALCMNRIDFAFLTDHPKNMATTEFTDLLLTVPGGGDQSLSLGGTIVGNQFSCSGDSHQVQVMAGYEDQLMPIGMITHLDPTPSVRLSLYGDNTPLLVSRLQSETNAIVMVPHTESRTTSYLSTLGMDGIEIYNLHANINPTMRTTYLGFDYFTGLIDLSVFWLDPYGRQQPDLAFMSFLNVSPVYAQKWNSLIGLGKHVTGTAGNDSHQNFFPGIASDGDRVDSHRRLTRWILNYYLINNLSLTDAKEAIKKGRGWAVFEGIGTPTGIDFYATNTASTAELGDTLTLINGSTSIHINLPALHVDSPRSGPLPVVLLRLKKIDALGNETTVSSTVGSAIDFLVTDPGAYRAEISIIPQHLINFLGYKKNLANQEMPWLISNHIYIQ